MRLDTNNNIDEMLTIGSLYTCDVKNLFLHDDKKADLTFENKSLTSFVEDYSSRGPLPDGARGVTFVAPGDAYVQNPKSPSSLPFKWIPVFGTSYSSPNAAGAIACLLSALKANSIQYSPATIKMALSNTAFLPAGGDRLAFGNGIIQIDSAFEYFKSFKETLPKIIFPKIILNEPNKKGILIYETEEKLSTLLHLKLKGANKKDQYVVIANIQPDDIINSNTDDEIFEKAEEENFEVALSKKQKKQKLQQNKNGCQKQSKKIGKESQQKPSSEENNIQRKGKSFLLFKVSS
uniref:Peptidase S8/S53 domain-containing protein n=1 Tax=Panagrolaimus sp. ES5 TaxID=591445 RepID=A0AC34FU95_9BILA